MSLAWPGVVGHEWAVQLLQGAIVHGRIGHAYLITGPEQIGKTTVARTFAQALNCLLPAPEGRPCGVCRNCTLIAADRHPDVRLVIPELSSRGKKTLKIEPVRQLQHDLSLAAHEARYKVAILRDFDAATSSAANAFLKTLEEPPSRVILLLTASDADSLLPTITSRCRAIGLRPLPANLIERSLQAMWRVSTSEAQLLAHLADGRLGWAVEASRDPSRLESREEHLEQLHEALAGHRVARFGLADRLARKPDNVPAVLRNWLSWWRDLTLLAYSDTPDPLSALHLTNIDQRTQLERLARRWRPQEIYASFRQTNLALWQLEKNANMRLVLENLLLVYPLAMSRAERGKSFEESESITEPYGRGQ